MKIYLDTCILVDAYFALFKKENYRTPQSKHALDLIDQRGAKGVHLIITNLTLFELFDVLRKATHERQLMQRGFFRAEISKDTREKYPLEKETLDVIRKLVEEQKDYFDFVDRAIQLNRVDEIHKLGLDFTDVAHLLQAESCGCEYLVTRDNEFLKAARRNWEEIKRIKDFSVKLVSPQRMLEILNKSKNKSKSKTQV